MQIGGEKMIKIPTINEVLDNKDLILPNLFDLCFKEIFGNEDYPEITEYLVAILFKLDYKDVKGCIKFIGNSKQNKRIAIKNSERDITFFLKLKEEYLITLEANLRSARDQIILDRNMMYVANVFGQGVKRGESYDKLRTNYQINFNTFNVDTNNNFNILDEYSFRNSYGNVFSEKLKIYNLNVVDLYNIWYTGNIHKYDFYEQEIIRMCSLLIIWRRKEFYKCLNELHAPQKVKRQIKEIVERLNDNMEIRQQYYNWHEEQKRINDGIIAERLKNINKEAEEKIRKAEEKIRKAEEKIRKAEEKIKSDSKNAMQKGLRQGIEQGESSIIRKFVDSGMSKSEISNILDLDLAEIDRLLAN